MKVALLGNPNTGKSSVFNMMTGLRQHVGNFPGITVDKKFGSVEIEGEDYQFIDFPGTYSLYPRSKDEEVVYNVLTNPEDENYPDVLLAVLDASNLERNLLFCSQLYDLNIPMVIVLNMTDVALKNKKNIHTNRIQELFKEAEIVETNARIKAGKQRIINALNAVPRREGHKFQEKYSLADKTDSGQQEAETSYRFKIIREALPSIEAEVEERTKQFSRWDKILVHPVFGYVIFAAILLVIFQFIFSFASYPMDLIDGAFASLSEWVESIMPEGVFTDLIAQGIIPGIGGVVIFVPQIALLFFFIAILEESGYLSRVVFIMDRIMRPLGLNGKSVVPLLSSVACAIPGVMAARTISDWKERLTTILVAPLMSCSARIPVYTLLIALVIPESTIGGFLNTQGLVLFGLYMLGTVGAILTAIVLKFLIKSKNKGFLLLEIPEMRSPHFPNVGMVVWEKVKVFIIDAGKIILAISIILWALASYGPSERMTKAADDARKMSIEMSLSNEETERNVAAAELKNSYIGIMGQSIEPVIKPLGYDWKIGISLITSFAAREVFVGSMATIYAVEDAEDGPLIDKMRNAKNDKGESVYTLASGVSLMVFYVFAMQCMATLAVVKRETKSWKWPLIQIVYMGTLAYIGALISFMVLS